MGLYGTEEVIPRQTTPGVALLPPVGRKAGVTELPQDDP
jgi:hypothetical protein